MDHLYHQQTLSYHPLLKLLNVKALNNSNKAALKQCVLWKVLRKYIWLVVFRKCYLKVSTLAVFCCFEDASIFQQWLWMNTNIIFRTTWQICFKLYFQKISFLFVFDILVTDSFTKPEHQQKLMRIQDTKDKSVFSHWFIHARIK